MTIKLNREQDLKVNHKRIFRLMKILSLKSVCRRKRKIYVKSIPEITKKMFLIESLSRISLVRNG